MNTNFNQAEWNTMQLMMFGLSSKEISDILPYAGSYINALKRDLLLKCKVPNATALIVKAMHYKVLLTSEEFEIIRQVLCGLSVTQSAQWEAKLQEILRKTKTQNLNELQKYARKYRWLELYDQLNR